jgi:RimJ/RimL family protein N-acetyltransferase
MDKNILTAREAEEKDIQHIANYWFTADEEYLKGMGVDIAKMPVQKDFSTMLATQLSLPYNEKKAYAIIWMVNGEPIGHCNLNPVVFGDHAYMHIHIWHAKDRKGGYGTELIKLSLPFFFKNMSLNKIYCQPYALNPAPSKTLVKTGFKFVKEYITTPGSITFEQTVQLWEIEKPL